MWNEAGVGAEDVVVWVGLVASVAVATWWLLGVAVWTVLLSRGQHAHPIDRSDLQHRLPWTLPGSQRLARALLTPGLLVSGLGAACTSNPDTDVPTLRWVDETPMEREPTTVTPTSLPTTSVTPSSVPPSSLPPSSVPSSSAPPPSVPPPTAVPTEASEETVPGFTEPPAIHHVVRAGDHLWSIATDHLTRQTGREPTNQQVAFYWRQLIERNRHALLSGNPNLIHVGEKLVLP